MDRIAAEREASQPLRSRTGGSTFKNPPGTRAWKLIDAAGCRGLRLGAAMVSDKHCNFLLNTGGATAEEVERLRQDCAEAYQVIGSLADRAGLLQYPAVVKSLENLDAATRGEPRPHADLLPIFLPDNENH